MGNVRERNAIMGFEDLLFLLLSLGAGQAGDLADYTPAEAYWQEREQGVVSVPSMVERLSDEQSTHVDRLMAIRTLGELGKADDAATDAALKALKPLVDSNEPFVGQYARRSIAWIRGDDPPTIKPVTRAQLDADLALIPEHTNVVGQFRIASRRGPLDLRAMLDHWSARPGPTDPETVDHIQGRVMNALLRIGNIRLDSLTLATHFSNIRRQSYAMFVGRGAFDAARISHRLQTLAKDGKSKLNVYSIDGVEVIAHQNDSISFALLMHKDERIVLMFGGPGEGAPMPLPVTETAKRMVDTKAKPALNDTLAAQVEAIDRDKADLWVVLQPKGPYLLQSNAALYGDLEAARATATRDENGRFDVAWTAHGKDADKIAQVVARINESAALSRQQLQTKLRDASPEDKGLYKPKLEMVNTLKCEHNGTTMTGEVQVPHSIMTRLPNMFFGMFGFSGGIPRL